MSAVDLSAMMTEDDFLEHAGVKGMKWGKRKAEGPEGPSRKELRGMNKVARAENREAAASARRNAKPEETMPARSNYATKEQFVAARAKFDKKNDAAISKARGDLASGKAEQKIIDGRKEYHAKKKQIGKVAARRALDKAEAEYYQTLAKSQQTKSGSERTAAAINKYSSLVISSLNTVGDAYNSNRERGL